MKATPLACIASLLLLAGTARAQQFGEYGVRAALGPATYTDDLSTRAPILGASVGGYINFDFTQSESFMGEYLYLQGGLNLTRRGSVFQEVFEHENNFSVRDGYMHAYYAQIPLLVGLHAELPIREAGHVVGVFVGPAVSVGLFGRYADRKVTPASASYSDNYDINWLGTPSDRAVFNHINRLDISAVLGVSYERNNFTFSIYIDHGFIATSKGEDILRIIENSEARALNRANNNNNAREISVEIPNGNNTAYMFSVAYKLGEVSRKSK